MSEKFLSIYKKSKRGLMMKELWQVRLRFEKAIMDSQLPQFQLFHKAGTWFFQGWEKGMRKEPAYQLKLIISEHYPDKMPELYITYPTVLPKYKNYGTINEESSSHQFHTCQNGPDGCVQICHFKSTIWDASKTCVGVFIKGILWLLSYELHLINGKSINDNLLYIKRRQENANRT